MPYHVIVKRKYAVAAIEVIGDNWTSDCPSLDFLAASYKDANTRASCTGFRALFEMLADRGPQGVTSAMMHEANKQNGIMELIKGRLRLLCFIEKDTVTSPTDTSRRRRKRTRPKSRKPFGPRSIF